MSDASDKSVNMSKRAGGARAAATGRGAKAGTTPPTGVARPTSVVAVAAGMLLAGLLAVFAGVALYGHGSELRATLAKNSPPVTQELAQKAGAASASALTSGLTVGSSLSASQISARADKVAAAVDTALPTKYTSSDQLKDQQKKARAAVTKALGGISGPVTSAQVATVSQSVSATVQKNLTTLRATQIDDIRTTVDTLPKSKVIAGLVLLVAFGFVAFGAYAGRYWARWGVPVIWVLSTFTGQTAGVFSLLQLGSDVPVLYRTLSALSAAVLLAALILNFLQSTRAWYDAHKPVTAAGAPARRGLFAPRVPPASAETAPGRSTSARPASRPATSRTKPAGAAPARTKKRAVDVTAPAATTSRPRTTSKSRRTES